MKKIKPLLFTCMLGSSLLMSSCSDMMDIIPTDQYTEEAVFSDAALTQAFVNEVYGYIKHGALEHTTTGLTDDAYFTHNYGQLPINEGTVSESDLQWYDNGNCPFKWADRYKGIRYATMIVNNIANVPITQGYDLNKMKGEAHFLRAYMYTELVRGFGGVPIVDVIHTLDNIEAMKQPRNTVKECIEYIVKECELAESLLPTSVSEKELGRATKYAATALKARALLHIASPLYADRTVNTLPINQYDGDRTALYQAAKEAALTVINSGEFKLIDCRGGSNTEIANRYKTIITDKKNSEQIFSRQFGMEGERNNLPIQHGPNGYHNWAGTTPTQDLVMAFEFEDGSLPEGMNKVGDFTIGNPYNGREPRFYASVGTDGNEWGRPRPADAQGLDPTPLGRLQCGYYEVTNGDAQISIDLPDGTKVQFKGMNGIDTRQGPIEDWNGSWTGYYERKLIDPTIDGQNYPQLVPWTYIRLAEMYLVAAEACIELNQLDEATVYLDAIRERIDLPATKQTLAIRKKGFTQTDMRQFLQHERRIELTYEESRYYDIRRWMIAPITNNKPLTGMLVFARLKEGQTQNKPYIHNEEKYTYYYYVKDVSSREKRKWDNKLYFAPIKRDEIRRNPNIIQNPGME